MKRVHSLLLILLLLASPVCAQVPFKFRGSAGAERQASHVYDRNGDTIGLNWKCQATPPLAASDTDRTACYCDSGGDVLMCSFSGSGYDFFPVSSQVIPLVSGSLTITGISNGAGSAQTVQLGTLPYAINAYNVSCNDPNGCNVLMPATDPTAGTILNLQCTPNQGPCRVFADPDDNFLARDWVGASPFASLSLRAFSGDWVEMSRSANDDEEGGFKQILVASNGGGTPADFEIDTGYPYFNVSCSDPDGCNLVAVNTVMAAGADQFTIISGGTQDVIIPDISNEIEVTGASITLTDLQTVTFIYNTVNWQQYTPVLP